MTPSDAFAQLQDLLGSDLQHIAGTSVSGEVPVRVSLVNRLIGDELARRGGALSSAHLEVHDHDRMVVHVTVRTPAFVPSMRVSLAVEQQPRFPDQPFFRFRWRMAGMGLFARLAGPALAFFKALPPGLHVDGDRLFVDIRQLARAQGLEQAARYLTGLQLHTRPDVLVLRFAIDVPRAE